MDLCVLKVISILKTFTVHSTRFVVCVSIKRILRKRECMHEAFTVIMFHLHKQAAMPLWIMSLYRIIYL